MQVFSPSVLTAISRFATQNAGAVNITAAAVDVITQDLGLCVPGQILFVTSNLFCSKGGVAGTMQHGIRQSGGAGTVLFTGINTALTDKTDNMSAGNQYINQITGIGVVTVAGQIILSTWATSGGSDSNCPINNCQMQILRVNR